MFEYFGAGYASQALQGVGTFFYATADVLPFGDDFAGGTQHPISDPTNAGGLCCQTPGHSALHTIINFADSPHAAQGPVHHPLIHIDTFKLGAVGRHSKIRMYTLGAPETKQMCEAMHCCRRSQRHGGSGPVR